MIGAALALMMASTAVSGAEHECVDFLKINTVEIQLGDILGSKTACGFEYDDDAIEAFIIKTVEGQVRRSRLSLSLIP